MKGGRIGILGGTFDPVHNGHLQLARAAIKECSLDRVVFIPAAQPVHKKNVNITDFYMRLEMIRLACYKEEFFVFDDIEMTLAGPSYTVDTLRAFKKRAKAEIQLFFIVGADAFLDFLTWKAYGEIFKLANIIIAERIGVAGSLLVQFLHKLGYINNKTVWKGGAGMKDIYYLKAVPDNCSSSQIRKSFSNDEIPRHCLSEKVIEYIRSHGIYTS